MSKEDAYPLVSFVRLSSEYFDALRGFGWSCADGDTLAFALEVKGRKANGRAIRSELDHFLEDDHRDFRREPAKEPTGRPIWRDSHIATSFAA